MIRSEAPRRDDVLRPYYPDPGRLNHYLAQTYASGWLTNHGPLVASLEERLAEWLGVPRLLLVANGTLALQLACRVLELEGEAITTPLSFVATPNALAWERLSTRFADVDPERLTLDPQAVAARIGDRTRAIVPVHLFGRACDGDGLQAVADRHGLRVIHDAAHAFDVRQDGQSVLHWGDASVLSFHATKVFHTVEGGALVLRDPALHERARRLRSHGRAEVGDRPGLGLNAKLSEVHAAMGHAMLDELPSIWSRLEALQSRYRAALTDLPGLRLDAKPDRAQGHSPAYLPVRFETPQACDAAHTLLAARGLALRRYFVPPLHQLEHLNPAGDACPHAEHAAATTLCLPVRADLPHAVVDEVVSTLRHALA